MNNTIHRRSWALRASIRTLDLVPIPCAGRHHLRGIGSSQHIDKATSCIPVGFDDTSKNIDLIDRCRK